MSEEFNIQEEYSLRHVLSWPGDSVYFGWKHGVNVTVSSQIGLQQDAAGQSSMETCCVFLMATVLVHWVEFFLSVD